MEHQYAPKEKNMKPLQVMELNKGDKIKLTNGDIMEFVELKRTKFVATMNGQNYSVPVNLFDSVVEKVDINKINKEKETEKKNILAELNKGDWFYINKNGNAIVFQFEEIKGNKIIGVNPINGGRSRIDMGFEIGKIEL
jgi:hypothetical protein